MTIEPDITLDILIALFRSNKVTRILAKPLAPNDNSKNQPYFGGDFQVLNILPVGEIRPEVSGSGRTVLKAPLSFGWLQNNGFVNAAPFAQLILYPQYPEVRFSGFLRNATSAPSSIMSSRAEGRILFLGTTADGRIIGWAALPDSPVAKQFCALEELEAVGVFFKVPMDIKAKNAPKQALLDTLKLIHLKGWINSYSLNADGSHNRCESNQCVGYTLEAELGVPKNGFAGPDYLGWEVKAGQVPNFGGSHMSKAVTLMTPEPTGGFYKQFKNAKPFVHKFGYPDKSGVVDRLNFGGVFRIGKRHDLTGLTLQIKGYDFVNRKIEKADGALVLLSDDGERAAEWSFAGLMRHWNTKHAQTVYVPALCRTEPARAYQYGATVRLGEGTDFLKLLGAVADGKVYYDPGIKLENASSESAKIKNRSQFRIKSGDIDSLYHSMKIVDLLA
jgi:hypothetical protein